MRRVTVVTMNVSVCWDQVPCSVVLPFWTNMLHPYYFYGPGSVVGIATGYGLDSQD